jgi:hypothetical protein
MLLCAVYINFVVYQLYNRYYIGILNIESRLASNVYNLIYLKKNLNLAVQNPTLKKKSILHLSSYNVNAADININSDILLKFWYFQNHSLRPIYYPTMCKILNSVYSR